MGADAQPDGTIGRRRFWRGTFLFSPETTDVGAGFKAWRPLIVDPETDTVASPSNGDLLRSNDHVRFSKAQYEGTVDDFYDRMEALINPRPLDPGTTMRSLVDALDESIARRIVSIDNAEAYLAANRGTISMPEGYAIFETTGPWEDYATPSRDLRLLIAIDAVLGFPSALERRPERFGLDPGGALQASAQIQADLRAEIASRRARYTKSNGASQELTLAEIVDRVSAFEMTYNPNDCVELRWGAPEGSDELSTCVRHAPPEQRARMERYRSWFHERRRPPR
jgi:hypothetical protein